VTKIFCSDGLQSHQETLTFGHEFNQGLQKVKFPESLRSMTFGFWYNQSLEGVLFPSKLEVLSFGNRFNHSLEGMSLPSTLESCWISSAPFSMFFPKFKLMFDIYTSN
jgi:hypothetical protein